MSFSWPLVSLEIFHCDHVQAVWTADETATELCVQTGSVCALETVSVVGVATATDDVVVTHWHVAELTHDAAVM